MLDWAPRAARPDRARASATSRSGSSFTYLWLPYMILPIFAGLERIPSSLLEASADLGGRGWMTFRRVILPLVVPAVVAGSIFTFSLTLGDYIVPGLVSTTQFIGNVIFVERRRQDLPLAAAYSLVPLAIMLVYLFIVAAPRRVRGALMTTGAARGSACGSRPALVLAFIYVPLALVVIYAFNESGDVGLAAVRVHPRLVRRGARQHRPAAGVPDVDRCARSARRSSRWSSGRWPRSRSPATRSSGARRSRSSSSCCRSPCRASSPAWRCSTTFATLDLPLGFLDDRRRPRHVLHRARLQQRHRPAAADVALVRGGVGRPRRATPSRRSAT